MTFCPATESCYELHRFRLSVVYRRSVSCTPLIQDRKDHRIQKQIEMKLRPTYAVTEEPLSYEKIKIPRQKIMVKRERAMRRMSNSR